MNKSEQIADLALSLSRAQGAIKGALKDSLNPHFKAKYADLASTWDACREQLAKNELSVVQMPDVSETGGIAVETILMHSSGQWISSRFVMPLAKPDAHGVGSAITYARRYALAAMVGIAPEDDDGNKAIEKDDKKEVEVMSERQIGDFKAKIEATLTKEQAKAEWQKALHACTVIQDLTAHERIKSVLLKHLEFIDKAVK